MKQDLAGGQFPSALFGANAAWRQIMILSRNFQAAMRRLVPGGNMDKPPPQGHQILAYQGSVPGVRAIPGPSCATGWGGHPSD